ncbi:xylulokinase [Frigoriglobus tundricola]|uniref:Xylulose kinase n=1 Tax=Frigoriglobus tundricola TaxID=2774151 RepID=A0A6M5YK08_9BACT|nr:FGGY-family carbohydrate kinase [Frigoriglobus tundricola]QJW93914.1 xylulose kinase [Frigoriglobus tundricola]
MSQPLRCVSPNAIIVGYDFSTGGVKALAFDLTGRTVAQVRLPTDLWTEGGVSELNLMQLEGQARAATRALNAALIRHAKLEYWLAAGVSATHHSAGRIDETLNQVRRAICWNDQTLAGYHAEGLKRLGGQDRAKELTGGPWAVRYSLSHLVKDEHTLSAADWERTEWILPHGPLAAGYLTGRFEFTSVSSAASTGIMDLRTNQWNRKMLDALAGPEHRKLAWDALPAILDMNSPIGKLVPDLLPNRHTADTLPWIFPTLDDQAAGLIGGGAVDAGQVAIILGNSAVVNSSSAQLPHSGTLDAMKLNWGPYLWMRCYSNGAQFVDVVAGKDWYKVEDDAAQVPPRCNGVSVLPFLLSEPSVGVEKPQVKWAPAEPAERPVRVRACLEALAFLLARAVREHEAAGQSVTRITVSGGMARSQLMCAILASVLNRPLERLVSDEGPALGAAVAALAGLESYLRKQQGIAEPYTAADAVAAMVKFRDRVEPVAAWVPDYARGMEAFENHLGERGA